MSPSQNFCSSDSDVFEVSLSIFNIPSWISSIPRCVKIKPCLQNPHPQSAATRAGLYTRYIGQSKFTYSFQGQDRTYRLVKDPGLVYLGYPGRRPNVWFHSAIAPSLLSLPFGFLWIRIKLCILINPEGSVSFVKRHIV